ncbi:MAG TPA: class I SAM-dependent methyltransferase [Chloroflexota bacterium]|jgi:SAM-dependent methyltransferase|nr:class I SAM-dependent methyltransferase [Chloroflexota bacterium]
MADVDRKRREREFYDHVQRVDTSARTRWSAAGSAGDEWLARWLARNVPGRRVLDYGCGGGGSTIRIARAGGRVTGIDISPISLARAAAEARREGVEVEFAAMDAERTGFPDATFEIVHCGSILHHLDPEAAFHELARVVKPHGRVAVLEPLGSNPLINWYRRKTPHMRTPDERPLMPRDLALARRAFNRVAVRYFDLASLGSAPLYATPLFAPAHSLLRAVDRTVLRLPLIREQAWQVGMVLAEPRR